MPLVKGKSDKAFSENVKREMDAGKPQKQAVAIAYSVKRHAEHKKMAHGGHVDDCMMCMGGSYSKGGEVRRFKDDESKEEIMSHDSPPSHEMHNRFTSEEDKEEIERGDSKSQMPAIMEGEEYYEEGGEVGPSDDEMYEHCAQELMEGLEKKDKKIVLSAIRAIMLSNRGE